MFQLFSAPNCFSTNFAWLLFAFLLLLFGLRLSFFAFDTSASWRRFVGLRELVVARLRLACLTFNIFNFMDVIADDGSFIIATDDCENIVVVEKLPFL